MTGTTQRLLAARLESIARAGAFTAKVLTDWGLPGRAEDIRLCASEPAANALLCGTAPGRGSPAGLQADDEAVRPQVHDSRRELPTARHAVAVDLSGRGLTPVDALADGWASRIVPCRESVCSLFKAAGGTAA
ncbi:ATP-binding protein [Streptomyces anthocyanicus]|uniref:ATP-binding protein n=1 Tax=Streptomyces anthocyanicus TaxID=68174 RepID=UPI0033AEBCB8